MSSPYWNLMPLPQKGLQHLLTLLATFVSLPTSFPVLLFWLNHSLVHSFNKNVLSSYLGPGTMHSPKEYNGKKEERGSRSFLWWSLQPRVEEMFIRQVYKFMCNFNWNLYPGVGGYDTLKEYSYNFREQTGKQDRIRLGGKRGSPLLELAGQIKNFGFLSYKQWGGTEVFQSEEWHDQIYILAPREKMGRRQGTRMNGVPS